MIFIVSGFAFQNEPEGFRGLKWGDPPGSGKDMSYRYGLDRDFDITIYERRNDKMQIGNAKLRDIHYLFYEDRFMAVEVYPELSSYDELKNVVLLKFGDGKVIKENWEEEIVWLGDLATIVLQKSLREAVWLLLIYSTEIWEEKEKEFSVKKEEAKGKEEEERRKAAEEGLDDF